MGGRYIHTTVEEEEGGDLVIRQRFHQVTKKSINTQPFAHAVEIPYLDSYFSSSKLGGKFLSCGHPQIY